MEVKINNKFCSNGKSVILTNLMQQFEITNENIIKENPLTILSQMY